MDVVVLQVNDFLKSFFLNFFKGEERASQAFEQKPREGFIIGSSHDFNNVTISKITKDTYLITQTSKLSETDLPKHECKCFL